MRRLVVVALVLFLVGGPASAQLVGGSTTRLATATCSAQTCNAQSPTFCRDTVTLYFCDVSGGVYIPVASTNHTAILTAVWASTLASGVNLTLQRTGANGVVTPFSLNTTPGVAANGDGVSVNTSAINSVGSGFTAAQLWMVTSDVTGGSEDAYWRLNAAVNGVMTEVFRVEGTGITGLSNLEPNFPKGLTSNVTPSAGDYVKDQGWSHDRHWFNSSGASALSKYALWDATDDRWEISNTSTIIGPTVEEIGYDGKLLFRGAPIQSYTAGDPITLGTAMTLDTGGATPTVSFPNRTIHTGRDLVVASCVQDEVAIDSGGATREWCVCRVTNVWACWNLAAGTFSPNGPTD